MRFCSSTITLIIFFYEELRASRSEVRGNSLTVYVSNLHCYLNVGWLKRLARRREGLSRKKVNAQSGIGVKDWRVPMTERKSDQRLNEG
jgi:hypothetical protein